MRRSSGGITTTATTTLPNVVTFSDQGLAPGTTYCYDVRAARTVGQNTVYSTFSNTACATTPSPPNAASGISAVESSSTSVTVTWADNSTNEDGFRINRINGGAAWELAGSVGPNVTSFVTDQPVCYSVVAFNAVGDAPPSPYADCTRPLAPSNPSVTSIGDGTFRATWTDNSAIETTYEVWFMTFTPCSGGGACDAGGEWEEFLLDEIPANSTSYVINWSSSSVTSAWLEISARRYVGYPSSRMVVMLPQ